MIASLTGIIIQQGKNFVVLDVHGVGYRVFVAPTVLAQAKDQSETHFFIHTHVREDAFDLYGFLDYDALELFEQLLSVSGVGPKTAMGVLTIANAAEIRNAIASGDASVLTKVSGIGKKTAERIVLELKEKTGGISTAVGGIAGEAIDALVGLGYSERDARETVGQVKKQENTNNVQAMLKAALKMLGK